jgi:hypothetical protein
VIVEDEAAVKRDTGTTLLALARCECRARCASFVLLTVAIGLSVAAFLAALASLQAHDRATEVILAQHEAARRAGLQRYDDDLRQAMRRLGFNLVLLPAAQALGDFYADGFAAATLPEDTARRLAAAGLVTVEQLVPVLRRKVRWDERGWTVWVQAAGPRQGRPAASAAEPDVNALPRGSVDLGYEIQRGLNLHPGDRVAFLGATFAVRSCRPATGTPDDLTVWMYLPEAQERLNLPGQVSEIQALACRTAWNQVDTIRADIAQALPGLTVLEKSGETLTVAAARQAFAAGQQGLLEQERLGREAQRRTRARLAQAIGALALLLAAGTSLLLAWTNARERRVEIGVWTALGLAPLQVQQLLLWRALLAGSAGAVAGVALGCPWWGWPGLGTLAGWALLGLAVAWAAVLPASALATALALRLDPAEVLKNEA